MGNEISDIPADTTNLVLTNRGYTQISIPIPKKNVITSLDLSGNHILKLPKSLKSVTTLYLSNNELETIPSGIESYLNIQILDLSQNKLKKLHPKLATSKSLRRVSLSRNMFETLDLTQTSLEYIDLEQNRFTQLPLLPNTVTSVNLNYNLLKTLHITFPHLLSMTARLNHLESIEMTSPLTSLDVSMNKLTSLPDLSEVSTLKSLSASHNLLVELPPIPTGLSSLDLSHNQITSIIDFSAFTQMVKLDFSNNSIVEVFGLPPNVTDLNLSANQISLLQEQSLSHLSTFYIYDNPLDAPAPIADTQVAVYFYIDTHIRQIDLKFFNTMVTQITIRNGRLTSVPRELFDLPALQLVCLSHNQITQLPDMTTSRIISLNISENPLESLSHLPTGLLRLYCGGCGLKELQLGDPIIILEACDNQLETIVLPDTISTARMSNNKIGRMPALPSHIELIDLSMNKLTNIGCTFDYPVLADADFSHNNIAKLPGTIKCPKLVSFKISHNPECEGQFSSAIGIIDIAYTHIQLTAPLTDSMDVLVSNNAYTTHACVRMVSNCGYAEMQGSRPTMEDTIVCQTGLYAVFDGHGGHQTALRCARELPTLIERGLKKAVEQLVIDCARLPDGSTAAIAHIAGTQLHVAHLGDARVLLITNDGEVRFTTVDHKPTSRPEFTRILNEGGRVENNRAAGMLAISRSIGDMQFFGVSHTADLAKVTLNRAVDKWLVLCCDGVFDVIENTEIGKFATQAGSAAELAYILRNYAFHRTSLDNISVVVVDLAI